MRGSRRIAGFAAAILITALAASALLLHRLDQIRARASREEVLYLTSPKLLQRLGLGYSGLVADIYWTRTVQYYGGKHVAGGGSYELLWPLLNLTTQLDPHLIPAYEYGSTFLSANPPRGAGLPQKAIQLVEYGISKNPDDWHLYYDLGFIYYDLKDYRAAADAFLRGSKQPKSHPFLATLAARMAEHGGELETARMLWSATYQTTLDKDIRANAATHLRTLQAEYDVIELQRRADIFRQRAGHFPASFDDMIRMGLLRSVPRDPLGHPYRLLPVGKVVVSDPDDFPYLEQGLPPDYVAKPSS